MPERKAFSKLTMKGKRRRIREAYRKGIGIGAIVLLTGMDESAVKKMLAGEL